MKKVAVVVVVLALLLAILSMSSPAQAFGYRYAGSGCGFSMGAFYVNQGNTVTLYWRISPLTNNHTTTQVRLGMAVWVPLPITYGSENGKFLGVTGGPYYLSPDPWPPFGKARSIYSGWTWLEYVDWDGNSGFFGFRSPELRRPVAGIVQVGNCAFRFYTAR